MKDSHAEDYASTCIHYGSLLQLYNSSLWHFAGAASMLAVAISASVYFVGVKLSLDPELWHWWFFGIVNWRVRSRRCFELSLPLLMMAIALQPEAWCEEQLAAILILAIFSSAAAFLAFFSWFIVPVSAPVTTLADWHKRVTSEAHEEGSSHKGRPHMGLEVLRTAPLHPVPRSTTRLHLALRKSTRCYPVGSLGQQPASSLVSTARVPANVTRWNQLRGGVRPRAACARSKGRRWAEGRPAPIH